MRISNPMIRKLIALLLITVGTLYFGLTFYPYLVQNFIEPNVWYQFYVPLNEYLFSWILSIMVMVGGVLFLLKKKKSIVLLNFAFGGVFIQIIYEIFFEKGGRLGFQMNILIILLLIFCFYYFNKHQL